MRIGCCTNMIAKDAAGIGTNAFDLLAQSGYDYLELPLAQIMALDEIEFATLLEEIKKCGLPCEVCNNFFPAHIRITGPQADPSIIRTYVQAALTRVRQLGAARIVFGSSGAKNVPEGFSMEKAWQQIIQCLQIVDEELPGDDILIVIEPLNRLESNIVCLAKEGLELAREVSRPHIQLLIDYYHLQMEKEPLGIVQEAGSFLQHIHIANPNGRIYPTSADSVNYTEFFKALKHAGYNQRVSVEAYSQNIAQDIPLALAAMRQADAESDKI